MTRSPQEQTGDLDIIAARYRKATERRVPWESTWRDCYANALPQRESTVGASTPGGIKTATLYDGTAPDAVEQLAASLLAELTPPWSRWFALAPGREVQDVEDQDREDIADSLEDASERIRDHFERSNFAVEIHQAYLDLVTVGTASLLFEEAPLGDVSAFRFSAVPLGQASFEEGADGRLETTFRRNSLTPEQVRRRFPAAATVTSGCRPDDDRPIQVIEALTREQNGRYRYRAFTAGEDASVSQGISRTVLAEGWFERSPFINFRWMKAPGEIYGRSPVMKALPDIKTANFRAGTNRTRTGAR